jgi:hypothetical protein
MWRQVSNLPICPSFELAAGYLANAALFLLVGPGILSLDGLLFAKRSSAAPPG